MEPTAGPGAGTAAARPPTALTSFVGRTRELEELCSLLKERRLVTVTGPGGCGKTRLVIEALRQRSDDGGVIFVDLAPIDADVAGAVARVAAVMQAPAENSIEAVTRVLSEQDVCLILDNCEHVVDEAAALIARLLAPATRAS